MVLAHSFTVPSCSETVEPNAPANPRAQLVAWLKEISGGERSHAPTFMVAEPGVTHGSETVAY
eukprot:11802450-Alexandrium_andersonii.AAC.1